MAIIDIQYRLDGGPWTSIGVVESFQIQGLTNGRYYSVQIRAVTEDGPGPSSTSMYRMPHAPGGGLNPPDPFTSNMWIATPRNGRATITINSLPDSDAEIRNIHYRVNGGIWNVASSLSEFDINGLINGSSYQIQIRAFSNNGASQPSDVKFITPIDIPEPPYAFTIEKWALHSDEEKAFVEIISLPVSSVPINNIQYQVDGGSWVTANTTSSFYITGLTNEVEYDIKIRAVNPAGTSADSDTKSVTPHDILHYPDPFADNQWGLVPGNNKITVTISSLPASETPITNIQYNFEINNVYIGWNSANTISNFDITGLTNGQTYGILIRAVNNDGPGGQSSYKTMSPSAAASVPSAFTVGQWSVTEGGTSVNIDISQLPNNNGSVITSTEYSVNGGVSWVSMGGSLTHAITNLTEGQSYNIQIRAVNALGPGAPSDTKSFTFPIRTPSAFISGNWSIIPSNGLLTVNVLTLPSTPAPITSIQYRIDGGSWANSGISGVESFNINSLINGQTYDIEIRAINAYGNGPASDIKTATPEGAKLFYVSLSGNNDNNGLTTNTAWYSVSKVNDSIFVPGDSVLFEGGSVFPGNLVLNANNITSNVTHQFTVSSYGIGKGRIDNSDGNTAVSIINIGNVVLDNLEITGSDTKFGVKAFANNNQTHGSITVKRSDVFGTAQTAIDVVSMTANSKFANVIIANNNIYLTGGMGVHLHGPFANTRQFNNVTIEYNNIHEVNEDAIVVSNAITPKIQHNIIANTGSIGTDSFGILTFQSSNGNISNNFVTKTKSDTIYSGGIAVHGATENFIVEYNFTSENLGPGLSVFSYDGGGVANAVVRYNISAMDGSTVDALGVPAANGPISSIFHNNTIYYPSSEIGVVSLISPSTANTKFYNNIFVAANDSPYIVASSTASGSVSFRGNLYWGGQNDVRWGSNNYSLASWSSTFNQERDGGTPNYVKADPLFNSMGSNLPVGYKVSQNSPALSNGLNLLTTFGLNPGNRDYFGSVSYGTRDIGAMNIAALDPNYKSFTSTSFSTRTNTSVVAPENIKNGDIMVIFFVIRGASGTEPTFSPPAGWNNIPGATSFIQEGLNGSVYWTKFATYWKRADLEPSSWVFSHNNFSSRAICTVISGGDFISDPVTNVVMSRQTFGGGSSQNINIGGTSIIDPKSVVLLFDVTSTNTARGYIPTNYTNLVSTRSGAWYRVRTTSGNENALSYNSQNATSDQPWAAVRLVIKK